MNLTEFIRKNDIQCKDGEEFDHSPEFFKMQEFERTCHTVFAVPFLEPQTYEIKEFDVVLKGSVREKWDRKEKKTKRQFFIDRTLRYPKRADCIDAIEDAVDAGKTIDQALESLELEKQWFEFFKRYDLIDAVISPHIIAEFHNRQPALDEFYQAILSILEFIDIIAH